MTMFWQRWLTLWCVGVAVFGLVLFGVGWSAADGVARAVFILYGDPLPADPDRFLRFTTSLMGAVTFGWAATLYATFRAAWLLDAPRASTIWRLVTAGAAIWYVIDSAASIANGFALNAVSNTVVMIGYLVPVVASGALTATPIDRSH